MIEGADDDADGAWARLQDLCLKDAKLGLLEAILDTSAPRVSARVEVEGVGEVEDVNALLAAVGRRRRPAVASTAAAREAAARAALSSSARCLAAITLASLTCSMAASCIRV